MNHLQAFILFHLSIILCGILAWMIFSVWIGSGIVVGGIVGAIINYVLDKRDGSL
jgi:hypothetical protein